MINETPEQEARRLRDLVYGVRCSDKNWEGCAVYWIIDLDWLRQVAQRENER